MHTAFFIAVNWVISVKFFSSSSCHNKYEVQIALSWCTRDLSMFVSRI